jgi:hypothetical protein
MPLKSREESIIDRAKEWKIISIGTKWQEASGNGLPRSSSVLGNFSALS